MDWLDRLRKYFSRKSEPSQKPEERPVDPPRSEERAPEVIPVIEDPEGLLHCECLSKREHKEIGDRIDDKFRPNMDENSLQDHINYMGTANSLCLFRSMALESYRKEEFNDIIPEELRPFVDRDLALEEGRELEYHEKRMSHVNNLVERINSHPQLLKEIELPMSYLFRRRLLAPNNRANIGTISNSALQIRALESSLSNIYSNVNLDNFGEENYIIGVDEDNQFRVRGFPKTKSMSDKIKNYIYTHCHAATFLGLDPEIIGQLVSNGASWAASEARFNGLSRAGAGMVGLEMLRSGQDNKHFHSSKPHEVIIGDSRIRSITVIDSPPEEIYYKTTFIDGTISVGAIRLRGNGATIYNSDMLADAFLHPKSDSNEAYSTVDLAGAIARDMFVLERRERYYQIENKNGGGRSNPNRNRVTWLPRFRINLHQGNYTPEELSSRIIRLAPTEVSGHPRRCDNPNQRQIELAQSLGIVLAPGYTYVREHDRGESVEFSRTYKSRSAMSLLYGPRDQ